MVELNKLYIDLNTFSLEIVAESVRNLALLKAAELTQSQLNRLTTQMVADTAFAGKAITTIQDLNILVDVDGSLSTILQQARSRTNQLCDELGLMWATSQQSKNPIKSAIEHAYAEAIMAADNLHSILGILCTAVSGPMQSTKGLISKFLVV